VVQQRTRGHPRKDEDGREPRASIEWRNGRAYGAFRAWQKWGGGREPLVVDGEKFATADPNTAALLFAERLKELRDLRKLHPAGLPSDDLDRLASYVGYHVSELANVEGRDPPTEDYVDNLAVRLTHAALFFADRGVTYLREITAAHVHSFMVSLRTHTVRGKTLSRGTQRQYMDALGHLLQRALSEGRVGRNWVREKVDLPTPMLRLLSTSNSANARFFWKQRGGCSLPRNRDAPSTRCLASYSSLGASRARGRVWN